MAYPIEELQPNSSEEQLKEALMATVQQMVSEGIPEEQAVQQAQEMLRSIMGQMLPNNRSSTNLTSGEFMRGSGSLTGGSSGYATAPNPRLNNINPASYPRGSI